jgi:hypothetical protein
MTPASTDPGDCDRVGERAGSHHHSRSSAAAQHALSLPGVLRLPGSGRQQRQAERRSTSGPTAARTTSPTVTVSPSNCHRVPLNAADRGHGISANIDPTTLDAVLDPTAQSGHADRRNRDPARQRELVFTPSAALTASTTYTIKASGFRTPTAMPWHLPTPPSPPARCGHRRSHAHQHQHREWLQLSPTTCRPSR